MSVLGKPGSESGTRVLTQRSQYEASPGELYHVLCPSPLHLRWHSIPFYLPRGLFPSSALAVAVRLSPFGAFLSFYSFEARRRRRRPSSSGCSSSRKRSCFLSHTARATAAVTFTRRLSAALTTAYFSDFFKVNHSRPLIYSERAGISRLDAHATNLQSARVSPSTLHAIGAPRQLTSHSG